VASPSPRFVFHIEGIKYRRSMRLDTKHNLISKAKAVIVPDDQESATSLANA
jgi:hypothetical protein